MTKKDMDAKNNESGSWRIILPISGSPEPHFVPYSAEGQYNLMSGKQYKTKQKAALALAILIRPTQLTHQERVELLALLEG